MACVHLLNKDTEPFAKCELDPAKIKWQTAHQFEINELKTVVSSIEK